MEIKNEFPPNYEKIAEHFTKEVLESHQPIFTYGDCIYNPWGIMVTPELIAHEEIHAKQTSGIGGAEKWWEMFLTDKEKRLEFETEAYAAQLNFRNVKDRNERVRQAYDLAMSCSSDLYGNMSSTSRALAMILKYGKK